MKNSEIEMQKKCRILPKKVNTKARLGKNLHEIFEFEISQPPFQSYTSSEKKSVNTDSILISDKASEAEIYKLGIEYMKQKKFEHAVQAFENILTTPTYIIVF